MSDTLLGWLNAAIGVIVALAGLSLTLRKDVVRQMAAQKYSEQAAEVYARFAGPLEISFGLAIAVEGLAIAGLLPGFFFVPGLVTAGILLCIAVGFWLFYLKRNSK